MMYAFRERPLTWLFLFATGCVSLVLSGADREEKVAIIALLFGESFVLGGWLVLGRSHRLLRGGMFVAGSLAVALLATIAFYEPPYYPFHRAWAISIGAVAVLAGSAAVMTLGWKMLLGWLSRSRDESVGGSRWQFPVAELFGWTIVVAVASAAMRAAELINAAKNLGELVATLVFALVAALLMVLLDERRRVGPISVIVAIIAVAAMFMLLPRFVPSFDRDIAPAIAGSYVYVVLWIVVSRLDRRIVEPKPAPESIADDD